ncbi:hypothetical protein LCGC14_1923060, partial [marine sediment metagenome]
QGNYALKLERKLNRYRVPIITMGHLHVHAVERIPYLEVTRTGKPYQISCLAMFLPGYMDQPIDTGNDQAVYSGYAKAKGMNPTAFGARPIYIDPTNKRFWTEV